MKLAHVLLAALILASSTALSALPVYDYKVTAKKPQSRQNFVQGLEFDGSSLYVSTGEYGKSKLLRYHFPSNTLEQERPLDPRLFGEGLTLFGDYIYQLTWRSRVLLIYNKSDLSGHSVLRIPGQGWGITHNDSQLIYSDGSDLLHFLSPGAKQITHSLAVTEQGKPVSKLNELEWIDGSIWANVWQTDRIVIIDPVSGKVSASVDLAGLLPADQRLPDTDVLNGIARNPADGSIWVTGKRWPWIYQIELQLRRERGEKAESEVDSR